MKIGMITDSLGTPSFAELLGTAAELGTGRLEFAAGNWPQRTVANNDPSLVSSIAFCSEPLLKTLGA